MSTARSWRGPAGGVGGGNHQAAAGGRRDLLYQRKPKPGEHAAMNLVRLAIPRRVYTQSHIDCVIEVIAEVFKRREEIRGSELVYEAPVLRSFTARLRPAAKSAAQG